MLNCYVGIKVYRSGIRYLNGTEFVQKPFSAGGLVSKTMFGGLM